MSQILVPSKAAEDGVFKCSSDCGRNICKWNALAMLEFTSIQVFHVHAGAGRHTYS